MNLDLTKMEINSLEVRTIAQSDVWKTDTLLVGISCEGFNKTVSINSKVYEEIKKLIVEGVIQELNKPKRKLAVTDCLFVGENDDQLKTFTHE